MSKNEIEVFEKVWKMLWQLIYKIAQYFGWNIENPYPETTGDAE